MKNQYVVKVFTVLVGCIFFIVGFSLLGEKTYQAYFSNDLFSNGTSIGPVDVSGLTRAEAKEKLQPEINTWMQNGEVVITYGGEEERLTKSEAVEFPVDTIIQTAKSGTKNPLTVLVKNEAVITAVNELTENDHSRLKKEELLEELKNQAAQLTLDSIHLNLVNFLAVDESNIVSTAIISNLMNEVEIMNWINEVGEIKIPATKEFSLSRFVEENDLNNFTDGALSVIATGIYETILPTNFDIVERHISLQLPDYAKLGYEAMFEKGNKDFIIYNNNPYEYTLSFSKVENGLQVELIGATFPNELKITLNDEQTYKPKTIIQYSSDIKAGKTRIIEYGKEGKSITVYRYILHNQLEDEKIKISEDYYKPVHTIELHSLDSKEETLPNTPPTNEDSSIGDPTNPDGQEDSNTEENNDTEDKENEPNESDDELWEDPEFIKR